MYATRSLFVAAAALALGGFVAPLSAQSDILLQLRSGSPAGDRVRVDSAGGFVALGTIGFGIIPASGAGWRMMWHPQKVAFRAGYVDSGGQWDEANIGYYSWAGGALNIARGSYSFAMGNSNIADADCSTALGSGNRIYGSLADGFGTCGFAAGITNKVRDNAGVAMGQSSSSDGDAAFALGYFTTADANYSMAFGYRASTNGHTGAKVFADASTSDSLEAVANNEFVVRAAGGIRMRTNATLTTGCSLGAGGGSGGWSCASSKTLKENARPVDGEELLAKIRLVPLTTWNWIDSPEGGVHMGPFAEDFHAAFGLGTDPRAIGHQDMDGVVFGAVKALEKRTVRLAAENERLARENEELRRALGDLLGRVERLEGGASAGRR